jgi:KRAB domain-containing zinc finger protein
MKRYSCDLCDYSTYKRDHLEVHSNGVHLDKKRFRCDHCDKAFLQKGSLTIHINSIHNKIKKYWCDLCDFSSYGRQMLEVHYNVHLNKKDSYQCDVCDKAFSKKGSLNNHNRIHKKLKRYSCELCSYTSCTKSELKVHSIRKHNPNEALKPDLDDLMKEAQKDKMIVSIEKIIVFE